MSSTALMRAASLDEPDLEEQDEDATAPLWRELAANDAASIFRGVPLS